MWKRFKSIISGAYIHLAGVMGALSLASLLSHVVKWEGVILALVTWWANTVRPIVDLVFGPVVHIIEYYLKIEFTLPVLIKDYLAVGIVFILSRWRGAIGGRERGASKAIESILKNLIPAIFLLMRTLFIWPVEMTVLFRNLTFARSRFDNRTDQEIYFIRVSHFLALLPVFYSLFIVVANLIINLQF